MGEAAERPVSEAYVALAEYSLSLGIRNIKDLPGCWEQQIDDVWWVAANGHPEPVKCSEGAEVPPYHMYLVFNGWPAGVIGPYGGTLVCVYGEDGDAEGKLIEAVRAASKGDNSHA